MAEMRNLPGIENKWKSCPVGVLATCTAGWLIFVWIVHPGKGIGTVGHGRRHTPLLEGVQQVEAMTQLVYISVELSAQRNGIRAPHGGIVKCCATLALTTLLIKHHVEKPCADFMSPGR